jgi:hypothetical protein
MTSGSESRDERPERPTASAKVSIEELLPGVVRVERRENGERRMWADEVAKADLIELDDTPEERPRTTRKRGKIAPRGLLGK